MTNKICYLIIEDPKDGNLLNTGIRETELGYVSIVASSMERVVERLEGDPSFLPDYIFIDWDIDMLREIKASPHLANSAVIIYTGDMSTAEINEAKQIGAAHCLLKTTHDTALTAILLHLFKDENIPFVLASSME